MVHIPSRAAPRQVLNVVILQRSKLMFYWYGESNIIPFGQCDWHFPPKYVVLLISLNLAVRQSKRLHLLYFSLVLRICVVSDSWLFQLLLLQYWLLSASWSFPFSNHHLTCIRIVFNPFFFFILRIGDGLHRKKQINKNAYALTYSHNHTHTHTHTEKGGYEIMVSVHVDHYLHCSTSNEDHFLVNFKFSAIQEWVCDVYCWAGVLLFFLRKCDLPTISLYAVTYSLFIFWRCPSCLIPALGEA